MFNPSRFTIIAGIGLALGAPIAAHAQTQLWQTPQTSSSTYTTSESSVFSTPFAQNREVADDFQVAGSIERVIAAGWGCGSCGAPNVDGVYVRFYEWTSSGPGALQHEVFVPEGDPGFVHGTLPFTLDITLPQPFQASGWHFISVQMDFGPGGGVWRPVQANSFAPVNKRVHSRDNLTGGTWAPDTNMWGDPINADAVLTLYGTPGAGTPVIDSIAPATSTPSGRIVVNGGLWGAEQGDGELLIDGLPAIVTHWNSDRIVGYVPEAVNAGQVTVEVATPGGTSAPASLTIVPREADGRVRWRFAVDSHIMMHRAGIGGGPDGSIYLNDYDGRLYKLASDGGLLWIADTLRGEQGGGAEGPVMVGDDGTIYVAANPLGPTVELLAYNPDGTLKWVFTNPSTISVAAGPNLGPDGNVYIVFNDFQQAIGAASFAPDAGSNGGAAVPRWTNPGQPFPNVHATTGTEIAFSSSTLGGPTDQIVVAIDADADQRIYAFAMADGEQRWLTPVVMSEAPLMQPQMEAAAGPSGAIYATESNIGSPAGIALQSYDPSDGSRQWVFDPGINGEVTAPVVGGDGVIYLGWDLGRISAVSPAGNEVWTYNGGPGSVRTMPAISPDNEMVLFGGGPFGQSGFIKALDAGSGDELFHIDLTAQGNIFAVNRPAFTPDSATAYVPTNIVNQPLGNEIAYVYAIELGNGTAVPGDLDGDGTVDVNDLLLLIGAWGACDPPPAACPADISGDRVVNVNDLLLLIGNWS